MATTPKKPSTRRPPAASAKTTRTPRAKAVTGSKSEAAELLEARAETFSPKPAPKAKPASKRSTSRAEVKAVAPARPKVRKRATPAAAKTPVTKAREAIASIPVPEVTPRNAAIAAASVGGIAAAVGAALFFWRASKADQPDYRVVEQDGDYEIREYPALVTASTEERGPRAHALNRGFDTLAGYIFAKTRPGRKISMTAPVLSDGSDKSAWRIRFIMPAGEARSSLPNPPSGVTLESEPPRRVAAVRFSGRATDPLLAEKEGALRSWLQLRSLPSEAKAEHAFYNSPMIPGPLRRNEVLVTLSSG